MLGWDNKMAAELRLPKPTSASVGEHRELLEALRLRVDQLRRMAAKYPVYLAFLGMGYRFDSPQEIDGFILKLQEQIAEYDRYQA